MLAVLTDLNGLSLAACSLGTWAPPVEVAMLSGAVRLACSGQLEGHRLLGKFLLCFILENRCGIGAHANWGGSDMSPSLRGWGAKWAGVQVCKLFLNVLANRFCCWHFFVPLRLVLLCFSMSLVLCSCRGFPRDEESPNSWACATNIPATSKGDALGRATHLLPQ